MIKKASKDLLPGYVINPITIHIVEIRRDLTRLIDAFLGNVWLP